MNREILFRGKRVDNGEWVEGFYSAEEYNPMTCKIEHIPRIQQIGSCASYGIEPETTGQYTGLTDKNGRKIFEGDILKRGDHKYVVEWCDDCAMFVLPCITDETLESDFTVFYGYDFEVIGNAYDNPELLGGESK